MIPNSKGLNEGAESAKPCHASHEDAYLTWCKQEDGYCYLYCYSCNWHKPDFEHGYLKEFKDYKKKLEQLNEIVRRRVEEWCY